MTDTHATVTDPNQAALSDAIDALVGALKRGEDTAGPAALPSCPSLDALASIFGLSTFERAIVLLCAGVELDARVSRACAEAAGSRDSSFATFALALAALPDPHWSALGPDSPLRHWHLVEIVESSRPLTTSTLLIDERVLNFLLGIQQPAAQLKGLVSFAAPGEPLVPSHDELASRIVEAWSSPTDAPPLTILTGTDAESKLAVAAAACSELGLGLAEMPADVLPALPSERATFGRLWERESVLSNVVLYIDAHDLEGPTSALARFVDSVKCPILVGARETVRGSRRRAMSIPVGRPTATEQRDLWASNLGTDAANLNGHVDRLASQFDLNSFAIRASTTQALVAGREPGDLAQRLWNAGRAQARSRLDDLADLITSSATWSDLVLPESPLAALHELTSQVRHRSTVYERWGFGAIGRRGTGVSALFVGPSGTGKTLGAEVLANELGLDLYRIDLSGVVSKYIGETEKNLRRVFDAAEEGGAVLFFDEADALFGKRSEVKDSHDRYANIEVNYLLQRMESYRGIAILATNLKGSLDAAFLRRIRFVVTFPFPELEQRAEIWRRVFPESAPTNGIDPEQLARLSLTGGNIRNIAVNAAFLAAADDRPIDSRHLLRAARSEYVKLERALPADEIQGWAEV